MIPLNENLKQLQRSGIRVFTNLARETPDCAMLTIGEPDLDTPRNIKEAAWASLERNETHYAPNQGIPELRKAVAEYETSRGNATSPDEVLITVGSTQALSTALIGILNPGDEVIVPVPAFSLYDTIITVAGGRTVPLDVTGTGFQITREALASVITPRTKAIVLTSPNNPTGVILNAESLAAVKEAVLGKPIFVISDNVYHLLSYGPCPDLCLDPELKEQMLLCQSFSKPYAMTGWRLGYLVCPAYVMDRLLLLSAGIIGTVPNFLQHAGLEALKTDSEPMRRIYLARRNYVTSRLKAMGLEFPEPDGAFYVFPKIAQFGLSSDEFCRRAIREGKVACVPGSCFGVEGYIRISYCYSDAELEKGMDRLEAFLKTL